MENAQWHIQILKVLQDDSKTDVPCHNFAKYDCHMIRNTYEGVAYVGVAFKNCQNVSIWLSNAQEAPPPPKKKKDMKQKNKQANQKTRTKQSTTVFDVIDSRRRKVNDLK